MKKIVLFFAPFAFMVIGVFLSTPAHADPLPQGCIRQPWGFLGSQVRAICDGPIRSDGSWVRGRIIATPAHYVPLSCYTSGGSYSSFTNCYGGYHVDYSEQDHEVYIVTPDTVLPDEPGHID